MLLLCKNTQKCKTRCDWFQISISRKRLLKIPLSIIIAGKTGVECWIFFKPQMWKCNRARNRTWEIPTSTGMHCQMSYLGTIEWPTYSYIRLFGLSSHFFCSRLKICKRQKFPKTFLAQSISLSLSLVFQVCSQVAQIVGPSLANCGFACQ